MAWLAIFSSDIAGIYIFFAGISGFVIFSSDILGFEIPSVLRYFCFSLPRFRDFSYFSPRFRDFSNFSSIFRDFRFLLNFSRFQDRFPRSDIFDIFLRDFGIFRFSCRDFGIWTPYNSPPPSPACLYAFFLRKSRATFWKVRNIFNTNTIQF